MDRLYTVSVKTVNKFKHKVYLDWHDEGWKNTEYIGKIVYSQSAQEWWFLAYPGKAYGVKELQFITDMLYALESETYHYEGEDDELLPDG